MKHTALNRLAEPAVKRTPLNQLADPDVKRTPLILLVILLLAACGEEAVRVEKTVIAEDLIAEGPHAHAILEATHTADPAMQRTPLILP